MDNLHIKTKCDIDDYSIPQKNSKYHYNDVISFIHPEEKKEFIGRISNVLLMEDQHYLYHVDVAGRNYFIFEKDIKTKFINQDLSK